MLAVRVVDSVDEAIEHVNAHGSGHSEAIVTGDAAAAARAFERGVDAACVYVNASTRFTDGGEFGMGAEIGNSTQKLHARGPIGLRELCTFKYVVEGDGHVRPEALPRRPRLSSRRPHGVASGSSAGRSTRRTSATSSAPGGAAPARARPRPAHAGRPAAAQGGRGGPGRRGPARALPRSRWPATSGSTSRALEIERGGASYTVDTLRELHEREPETS